MTVSYTAPQLLSEVGKKIRFVSGYSRINEFTGLQFTYCGEEYEVSCGYTRTNGKVDSPDWNGVALLFVNGFHYVKPVLWDTRFHIMHQVGMLYVVRSGRLETEGELLAEVIDNLFGDQQYDSPVDWVRTIYPHEVIVTYDPPLIWNNGDVSTAFPLFLNTCDHLNTTRLKEYFGETYKKHTSAEDEVRKFSVHATEFSTDISLRTPRYSDEDVSHFLRILDRWIANDVLHLETSEIVTS